MSWVRLDDHFPDHPKVANVDPVALALHIAGLCYASRQLTDGFVPQTVARRLIDVQSVLERYGLRGSIDVRQVIAALVAAGMWHEADGGYMLHDYLDFNPSRSKVLQERERAAERQANRRRRSGELRANSERSHARSSNAPVPLPPSANASSSPTSSGGAPEDEDERVTRALETLVDRRCARQPGVNSPARWKRKALENARSEEDLHLEAAKLLKRYPSITDAQLVDVLDGQRSILRWLEEAS